MCPRLAGWLVSLVRYLMNASLPGLPTQKAIASLLKRGSSFTPAVGV